MSEETNSPTSIVPAVPTTSDLMPAAPPVLEKSESDRDFDRYEKERPDVVKAELESEKNYDTLLVTLSTLAIATSLTLLKEVVGQDRAGQFWMLGLAWLAFVICLAASLYHRKLTYETHKKWREILDAEFTQWKTGAWTRAMAKYDQIPRIKVVDPMKDVSYWSLIAGVVFVSIFVLLNLIGKGLPNAVSPPAATSPTYSNTPAGSTNQAGTGPTSPTQTVSISIGSTAGLAPVSVTPSNPNQPTTAPAGRTAPTSTP